MINTIKVDVSDKIKKWFLRSAKATKNLEVYHEKVLWNADFLESGHTRGESLYHIFP